jgi:hypothetical protein
MAGQTKATDEEAIPNSMPCSAYKAFLVNNLVLYAPSHLQLGARAKLFQKVARNTLGSDYGPSGHECLGYRRISSRRTCG